ncbi:3-hydroxybutyryl-CoA dehydrogenase [Paenibacillus mendelii]|uniref:3-hydroxybutyryl-CoA dehydrogenase n=1 Tax=Paenibacillus mendelii TaxID=206163 RepID=A0ABV6JG40_9BACL|nr:3-hydroxybutyryl-CoA dehydrogenase [Paenibacillus mendelii]MCQ6557753.1 3-hydroxybutyryl-CoA dehydrogenase [Paenibacillus mendelii]
MEIRALSVIGAGQMGSGIAQTAAQSGLVVTLYDSHPEAAKRGQALIFENLTRSAAKGRITKEAMDRAFAQIRLITDLEEARDSDMVIEAAPEDKGIKRSIFQELDRICLPSAILATNTSSLSITEIAGATRRPERVIGMHFMNPVPVMPLVEIIRGLATSGEVLNSVQSLAQAMGKTPVEVSDFPGFVSNRILMPMINEAIYAVYEGVASPEAVDQVMKLGMNHPMGPLALADFIGLDTCLAIMETLHEGFGDSKYRPCPLLRQYVRGGWLGRKAGRGFFAYD